MPRSRRRHHSRSRSRSRTRSHSHDRDRDIKRRKIDSYDSPHHRRSVSSEPEAIQIQEVLEKKVEIDLTENKRNIEGKSKSPLPEAYDKQSKESINIIENEESDVASSLKESQIMEVDLQNQSVNEPTTVELNISSDSASSLNDSAMSSQSINISIKDSKNELKSDLSVTPIKVLSPAQLKKRQESEKKKLMRQQEKEEKERKKQEEKERAIQEKLKLKQEKEDQKKKELELKQKEREQKEEQKRKEKEIKEEQKRKEKEERDQKKREKEEKEEQKRKEKEAEKLKQVEQMQKSKAVFANFFVMKKVDNTEDKKSDILDSSKFMPFEVKSDMRLAPRTRRILTELEKDNFINAISNQNASILYLSEIKQGKSIGRGSKTWPNDEISEDVVIVEENVGEAIEEKQKAEKMRAKFFKFDENQRPPYYGTWRKLSKRIKPKNPFKQDLDLLNYEVDSDDEWEEEDPGESLKGSDDEDKDNESDNEYEVDNEFFVPHGHLSDDEVDDEENSKLSPDTHKAKLKLLKNEFDEEMKSKTQKLKPRLIGCIWYEKVKKVDEAIDKYLQPYTMLCTGRINIKSRNDPSFQEPVRSRVLEKEYFPDFLRLVHGNTNKRGVINEFIEYLKSKNLPTSVSKRELLKQLKTNAHWVKIPDVDKTNKTKFWWIVPEHIQKEYNVQLSLPN